MGNQIISTGKCMPRDINLLWYTTWYELAMVCHVI